MCFLSQSLFYRQKERRGEIGLVNEECTLFISLDSLPLRAAKEHAKLKEHILHLPALGRDKRERRGERAETRAEADRKIEKKNNSKRKSFYTFPCALFYTNGFLSSPSPSPFLPPYPSPFFLHLPVSFSLSMVTYTPSILPPPPLPLSRNEMSFAASSLLVSVSVFLYGVSPPFSYSSNSPKIGISKGDFFILFRYVL